MTGYWTKSFDGRTAKVYISPETPIRSYFTVIAVPDGVDREFPPYLRVADVADRRQEGLFVLEPGPGGRGSFSAEAGNVEAAMSFFSTTATRSRRTAPSSGTTADQPSAGGG